MGRAAKAAARPAFRGWLRPSLRRRVGAALAIMSITGFIVIFGSVQTVDHLFVSQGDYGCGGIQAALPAFPSTDGGCCYGTLGPTALGSTALAVSAAGLS